MALWASCLAAIWLLVKPVTSTSTNISEMPAAVAALTRANLLPYLKTVTGLKEGLLEGLDERIDPVTGRFSGWVNSDEQGSVILGEHQSPPVRCCQKSCASIKDAKTVSATSARLVALASWPPRLRQLLPAWQTWPKVIAAVFWSATDLQP